MTRNPAGNRNAFVRRHGRRRIKMAVAVSLFTVVAFSAGSSGQRASAIDSSNAFTLARGFDTCDLPSPQDMQNFWDGTPYWWYSVYIGGSNYSCRPARVDANWLNTVHGQGWNFIYTWVGPQPPCSTGFYTFSWDPGTAYNEGRDEAVQAIDTLVNDGVANQAQEVPIVYDLEVDTSGCQGTVNSFIQGWTDYMDQCCPEQLPLVYGGVCSTSLASYAGNSPPPFAIWGAYYDGNPSTADLWAGNCGVPNGLWEPDQRFKQYTNSHWENWNGSWLWIDNDCASSYTSPSGANVDSSCS